MVTVLIPYYIVIYFIFNVLLPQPMLRCSYCNRGFATGPDGRLAMTFHHILHEVEDQ